MGMGIYSFGASGEEKESEKKGARSRGGRKKRNGS